MRVQRLSDDGIAQQLGEALRERRLRKDIIQEDLAARVGVSVPTLQKLEKGRGTVQLLIAVLRELNSLDLLSSLLAAPRVSPLAVAKSGKVSRVRASGSRGQQARVAADEQATGAQSAAGAAKPLLIPRK
ncbi:helix-turn-helix transcriptional regulator [Pseudomonas sp. 5P_3.1_Bac2]|uniref:helix-turn-helix transcriptional regulator n=1 Tax=Pseudomonas sp. 5P_3.1_Bac2 TaxID=2971617 RepID=UPI0021C7CCD0|nr:helix-turn-helix transcriptional regulator [Pseudomonas sp. 5P_3.1_Bac2]MCU1716831.1 helix-turn-helix domain-containing protein [Pseudomonas sp. 5P_3.1_Bac2]